MLLSYDMMNQVYMVGTPRHYKDHLLFGTPLFFMVNGSESPKIVDIYYEKDLTFIELCFSRNCVKCMTLYGASPFMSTLEITTKVNEGYNVCHGHEFYISLFSIQRLLTSHK
jgi:hypothetical protein